MATLFYEAQEKQKLFHQASADEVFYGGAAGGGKSYAIIWDAVSFALSHQNVTIAIFRRTYPELEKSIILEALRSIPASLYTYNKKEHRMYIKRTGSIIEFNYCQYESDVYNFQSAQYERIYFDELTHFPKFIYQYLTSRCRTTKEGIKTQIKSASNPGNIGHGWVKARFIENVIPNEVTTHRDPETGSSYTTQFIPARLQDNSYLSAPGNTYIDTLKRLDPENRRMLLDGDWDVLKGQFFTEWRRDIHVVEPFEIPDWWVRVRGIDWGYTKPAAVVWIAFDPGGVAYIYRELIVTEHTDHMLAGKVMELSRGEEIKYTMADPAMWSVSQYERGESIAYRLIQNGLIVIRGDNNRMSGWSVIRSYLHYDEEKKVRPRLFVFNTCSYVIETIPAAIHDEHKPEDLDTNGDDHALDAIRYALMTRPIAPKKPKVGIPQNSIEYWLKKKDSERRDAGYVGTY